MTPNRTELATLLQTEARRTGRRVDASTETSARARVLLDPGPEGPGVHKAVIVTLGSGGVVVMERVGAGLKRSIPVRPDPIELAPLVTGVEPCDDPEPEAPVRAPAPPADSPEDDGAPADSARVGDYRVWEVAADKVATVDSTGAGDAFCGALAAALAEGRSLSEAVRRAVAGAALATTHSGAREGMPTASELDGFLALR